MKKLAVLAILLALLTVDWVLRIMGRTGGRGLP
jgi:hypothetical protein